MDYTKFIVSNRRKNPFVYKGLNPNFYVDIAVASFDAMIWLEKYLYIEKYVHTLLKIIKGTPDKFPYVIMLTPVL